jgi:hypothetical protein
MIKSKLDSVIEDLIKTAGDAVSKDIELIEKRSEPTITSVLAQSLIKVAEALKAAQSDVTVDEVKESIK